MTNSIKFVYKKSSEDISHAWDAAKQRQNYDSVKRHERYERDKLAGKTGYKGAAARTTNPYGNFASVYYNPDKAHEYYMNHRRLSGSGGDWRDRYRKKYGKDKQEQSGAAGEAAGGSGGSGGSGGGGRDPGLAGDLAKLREVGAKEKEKLRKDAQEKIKNLREETATKAEEVRKIIEEERVKGKKERENKRDEVNADIEKEKGKSKKDIAAEEKQLKSKRDAVNDPLKRQNAALRGRLEHMSKSANPMEKARLQRMIAQNNDKISKANAEFTDSLTTSKTKHNFEMRNAITQLRFDLRNFTQQSMQKQRESAVKLRNELKTLRKKNQDEMKRVRQKLKLDLLESTKSTQEKINQRQGRSSDTRKLDAQINQAQKDYERMGGTTYVSAMKKLTSGNSSSHTGRLVSGMSSSGNSSSNTVRLVSGMSSGSSRTNTSNRQRKSRK